MSEPLQDASNTLQQDAFEQKPSRYIVGIDLGTTNCAVAFIDTTTSSAGIRLFNVPQWVDFATQEKRPLLPSFHYQPLVAESSSLKQAGAEPSIGIVGELARDRGLQLPGRQIASAKSWLSHAGVDRRAPILPWQADEGVEKLSPVAASASYLSWIRQAWDHAFPSEPLAEQDVVLTLPASFDQIARQLTIDAAQQAGLQRVLPIEEPQAAFYAWLSRHHTDWEERIQVGQTILVCDIGGGTTDFTLIRVREASAAGGATINELHQRKLSLHRVAVGQHLILGGDNIDLALARHAEQKLTGGSSLPPRAWDALRQACRVAKETLLQDSASDASGSPNKNRQFTIQIPGSGSRLVSGGSQVNVTAEEVASVVLDGFFPTCSLRDVPHSERTGFQEFGLPFASDARVTHHLALFLWQHRLDGQPGEVLDGARGIPWTDERLARPDWILFNGGVMTSSLLANRLVNVIGQWFAGTDGTPNDWQPGVLEGESLALAVAIGAAYFGQVRRGVGVQIEAKLACSYYLQTQAEPPLGICLVPGSASAGDSFSLDDQPLELTIGQPVQFPLLYSTVLLADRIGDGVRFDEEHFGRLPPIRTVLEGQRRNHRGDLSVVLSTELTQIGTLQMWCNERDSDRRWKLEFDVRGSTQTDANISELSAYAAGVLDQATEDRARGVMQRVFGRNTSAAGEGLELPPAKLMDELTGALELNRSTWPPNLLRSMWQVLMELQDGRKKSPAHEARWLNLLGYALRPGFGLAADDWRVAESWRTVHGKLSFASGSSRNESLILWRRIAGGFTAGQQLTVYQQIAGPLRAVLDPVKRAKGGGGGVPAAHEFIELLRLVGSLELLPKSEKHTLGDWLLQLVHNKKWQPARGAMLWAVGRIGTRLPAYGPLNVVVDVDVVEQWLEKLMVRPVEDANFDLALMLCARRVSDRYRDISDSMRMEVAQVLEQRDAPKHLLTLVRDGGQLAHEQTTQVLGESLPLGLRLRQSDG